MSRICVYAICKNEIAYVDKWFESMSEADEIVVLDTGSTDGTFERLKELGVKVEQREITPWRFDAARNASLDMAYETDCDIFLCTDIDEYFDPGWADCVREMWPEGCERGFYMYAWAKSTDDETVTSFWYDKMHKRGWHWMFPCHECLVKDGFDHTKSTMRFAGGTYSLEPDDITVSFPESRVHLHHDQNMSTDRSSYLQLIELRANEFPWDRYGWMYLGREFMFKEKYDECRETILRAIDEFADEWSDIELCGLYCTIGDSYMREERYHEALPPLTKAMAILPTARQPMVHIARCYIAMDALEIARGYLMHALRNSVFTGSWLEISSYWTWETYNWLCYCCYWLGDHRDALKWALKARKAMPESEMIRHNIDASIEKLENELDY